MAQIMELFKKLSEATGLEQTTVMYIVLAVILAVFAVLFLIVIVAIVKSIKRKASASKKTAPVTAVKQEPVKEQVITASEKIEEVKEEEIPEIESKEEVKPVEEVKEQTPVEVKAEEPITEKVEKKEKPAAKKPAAKVKKEEPKKEEVKPVKKQLFGKWIVELKREGEYMAALLASNGELMLSSEIYTTEDGARSGIATIIKGVDSGKFVIYQDKNKNYYYKLKTSNNRLLCVGEIYKSKDQCLKAVETVKRIAAGSPINAELVLSEKYIEYVPAEIPEEKKGVKGKWRIEQNENGTYSARLYANNGQLMLTTEEVSLRKSAENAVLSVKKNALEGNFIIDHDKFGRFYYKLRNSQKSVICIGEAYDTLESCNSAIESVRRFATQADVPEKNA